METRIFAQAPKPLPKGAALTETIHSLRFLQHSALVITLFIAVYLAYWHVSLVDDVPVALIVTIITIIATQILAHLAQMSATFYPETSTTLPLRNTVVSSILMVVGYASFLSVRGWNEGDDWFKPIRENKGYSALMPAGVEEHHRSLGRCGVVAGGAGLLITLVISVLAVKEASKAGNLKLSLPKIGRGNGYVAIGEEGYEFDEEETICADETSIKSA